MSTTLDFFIANFALESQQSEECINGYQNLLTQFPNSNYINCQIALAYYQALGLFFKFKENIEINFYFINLQKKKKRLWHIRNHFSEALEKRQISFGQYGCL